MMLAAPVLQKGVEEFTELYTSEMNPEQFKAKKEMQFAQERKKNMKKEQDKRKNRKRNIQMGSNLDRMYVVNLKDVLWLKIG